MGTFDELRQLETWYWDAERLEEAMSIPVESPDGKTVALPENVGHGIHFFRKTDRKGKEVDALYADSEDGARSILPLATIIEMDGVKCLCHTESHIVTFKPSKDDPWFLLAARLTCFLNQKLTDVEKVKALPRPNRKRIGKGSPDSQVEVNIVRWRKVRYESNKAGRALRDKCWPVKGHVRWQWYPSDRVHKPKWIETHIRGNPNAPLHVKTRINSVVD